MEVNPITVAEYFVGLVRNNFPTYISVKSKTANEENDKEPTEVEKQIAKSLLKNYFDILTDSVIQEEEELNDPSPAASEASAWSQSSFVDDRGVVVGPDKVPGCSIDKKVKILNMVKAHPEWSIELIQRRGGPEYKSHKYKSRWEKQIKAGGTKFEKFKLIDQYTLQRFQDARKALVSVRDSNLREWAIQARQTFADKNFKFRAGRTWVNDFKKRHAISSRKITKLVSRGSKRTEEDVLETAQKFQQQFRISSTPFPVHCILNSDQMGFKYEVVSTRTLSHKGEKITKGVAKSPTNLATHSYTVQYVISQAGFIVGDVFVCLQERSGRLGPRVEESMPVFENITVTCSKSGMLTTSLYEYFLDNVLVPAVNEDFLFVIDSWTGQVNPNLYSQRFGIPGRPKCTVLLIPPGCTQYAQPLDTTVNLQIKKMVKKICDEAARDAVGGIHKDDEITTRNNILKMHSLVHNQLSAEIFHDLIRYSFFSAGLTDDRPLFSSVVEACFTFDDGDSVNCEADCNKARFIKCARCRKIICFDCFFHQYHFHFKVE